MLGADLNSSESDCARGRPAAYRELSTIARQRCYGLLTHDHNHLTVGPQTMAAVRGARRCGQSVATERQTDRPTSLERPPDQAHQNQPRCLAGNRYPALPTVGGLANRSA